MALDAVVYPQDPLSYGGGGAASWGYEFYNSQEDDKTLTGILEIDTQNYHQLDQQSGGLSTNWDYYSSSPPNSVMQHVQDHQYWDPNTTSSPDEVSTLDRHHCFPGMVLPTTIMDLEPLQGVAAKASGSAVVGRRKRRRTKSTKNMEEIENQRMTHIAVERNRRKQMNEYLAALRSLMPSSYVQRGDQASIVGGAINFVKELEQLLQNMEAHKRSKEQKQDHRKTNGFISSPFAEFFTFPQYSTRATQPMAAAEEPMTVENKWVALADIEVTMVESHANLKILSKKRPRQLLKMVAGLQGLRLSILHLNVTAVDQMVLYSFSVKAEEGCHLNTVDEIAAAVNRMIHSIEEEVAFS